MLYLVGVMALVATLSGLYGGWEHKGKLAAEAQFQACEAKIESQNAAIQQTKAEGDRRGAEASKGVKAATQATAKARSEAERLRTLTSSPNAPSACPAGQAVAEVRKGLQ